MKRARWVPLAVLSLSVFLAGVKCPEPTRTEGPDASSGKSAGKRPPVEVEGISWVDLKGKKLLTDGALFSAKFGGCKKEKEKAKKLGEELPPVDPTGGGFVCGKVIRVELGVVQGDDEIRVASAPARLDPGDCIMWEATDLTTNAPAMEAAIIGIDFLNPGEPGGKGSASTTAVADDLICEAGYSQCVMKVNLPTGCFRYEAFIFHDDTRKTTDPEMEVACDGCEDPNPPSCTVPAATG